MQGSTSTRELLMVERESDKDEKSTFKQRTASRFAQISLFNKAQIATRSSEFPFCGILKAMGANWWHDGRLEMVEKLLSRFDVL